MLLKIRQDLSPATNSRQDDYRKVGSRPERGRTAWSRLGCVPEVSRDKSETRKPQSAHLEQRT